MLKRWFLTLTALAGAMAAMNLQAGNCRCILDKPVPKLRIDGRTFAEVGFFTPIQLPWQRNLAVHGFRLGLGWLTNPEVVGLDLSLVGHAERMKGVELGVFNAAGSFKGFQAGLYNGSGWNLESSPDSAGFQVALINEANNRLSGVQAGLVNLGDEVNGLQLGFLNSVRTSTPGWTLQIGFLNFNDDGWFPVMPLIGWSYRGACERSADCTCPPGAPCCGIAVCPAPPEVDAPQITECEPAEASAETDTVVYPLNAPVTYPLIITPAE